MSKRFIFDIDGTILEEDYSKEREFFKKELSSQEGNIFIPQISDLIKGYERDNDRYDVNLLSDYLTRNSGVEISPELIYKWREVVSNYDPKIVPGAEDMLYYIWGHKSDYIIGLSNWFGDDQMRRLEKAGLLKYFDNFYGGDFYIKPSKASYLNAAGRSNLSDCIVIGDSLENDVYGPYSAGMDAYYFDRGKEKYNKKLVKSFKRYTDLMRRF